MNPSSPTDKHFITLVNVSKIFSNHVDGICNVRSMYIVCDECLCICRSSWSWHVRSSWCTLTLFSVCEPPFSKYIRTPTISFVIYIFHSLSPSDRSSHFLIACPVFLNIFGGKIIILFLFWFLSCIDSQICILAEFLEFWFSDDYELMVAWDC